MGAVCAQGAGSLSRQQSIPSSDSPTRLQRTKSSLRQERSRRQSQLNLTVMRAHSKLTLKKTGIKAANTHQLQQEAALELYKREMSAKIVKAMLLGWLQRARLRIQLKRSGKPITAAVYKFTHAVSTFDLIRREAGGQAIPETVLTAAGTDTLGMFLCPGNECDDSDSRFRAEAGPDYQYHSKKGARASIIDALGGSFGSKGHSTREKIKATADEAQGFSRLLQERSDSPTADVADQPASPIAERDDVEMSPMAPDEGTSAV